MKNITKQLSANLMLLATAILLFSLCICAASAQENKAKQEASLTEIISALDTEVFDAFNHCDDPKQLLKHTNFFAKDVEFYHDNGGVTWNRKAMIGNTKRYVCGNYRRELIAGSMKVFPIKGFGAISQGVHQFCSIKTGKCEGMAEFVTIWKQNKNQWQITRVLSYGHREIH